VPSANVTVTTESSAIETERTELWCGAVFISRSSGSVI
jgi:hypothetical protein